MRRLTRSDSLRRQTAEYIVYTLIGGCQTTMATERYTTAPATTTCHDSTECHVPTFLQWRLHGVDWAGRVLHHHHYHHIRILFFSERKVA